MESRSATTRPARPRVSPGRGVSVLTLALVAAVLLVAAELSTVASVEVAGNSCEVINDSSPALADRCSLSGFERHGGALLLLAAVAVAAAFAATRGKRAGGATILVVAGVVVLALALFGDLPETNETGAIGRNFDGATAEAGLGFYLELLGGVLCSIAGALALARTRDDAPASAPQASSL